MKGKIDKEVLSVQKEKQHVSSGQNDNRRRDVLAGMHTWGIVVVALAIRSGVRATAGPTAPASSPRLASSLR